MLGCQYVRAVKECDLKSHAERLIGSNPIADDFLHIKLLTLVSIKLVIITLNSMDSESTSAIKSAFFHVSKGANFLTPEQLDELLYVLGCKPLFEEPYYSEIQTALDKSKKGVTFDALMRKLTEMMTPKCSEKDLRAALAIFEEEGTGKVNKSEVKRALSVYSNLPKEEIDSLLGYGVGGELMDINDLLKKFSAK